MPSLQLTVILPVPVQGLTAQTLAKMLERFPDEFKEQSIASPVPLDYLLKSSDVTNELGKELSSLRQQLLDVQEHSKSVETQVGSLTGQLQEKQAEIARLESEGAASIFPTIESSTELSPSRLTASPTPPLPEALDDAREANRDSTTNAMRVHSPIASKEVNALREALEMKDREMLAMKSAMEKERNSREARVAMMRRQLGTLAEQCGVDSSIAVSAVANSGGSSSPTNKVSQAVMIGGGSGLEPAVTANPSETFDQMGKAEAQLQQSKVEDELSLLNEVGRWLKAAGLGDFALIFAALGVDSLDDLLDPSLVGDDELVLAGMAESDAGKFHLCRFRAAKKRREDELNAEREKERNRLLALQEEHMLALKRVQEESIKSDKFSKRKKKRSKKERRKTKKLLFHLENLQSRQRLYKHQA